MTEEEKEKRKNDVVGRVEGIQLRRRESDRYFLPSWPEAKRGTPNVLLRGSLFTAIHSKDREWFTKPVALETQDAGISVTYSGEQLNQDDLTVWQAIIQLGRGHALGDRFILSAYEILQMMEMSTGNSQHKMLHATLLRLQLSSVRVTKGRQMYFGPLIKSGAKDEISKHYSVELNRELISLFGANEWTMIDWHQRRLLRNMPLALALHSLYSTHAKPFPLKLETLHRVTGSKNANMRSFKQKLKVALQQLIEIGFLESYDIDENNIVTVVRKNNKTLAAPQPNSDELNF
jgi:hypothetical protein